MNANLSSLSLIPVHFQVLKMHSGHIVNAKNSFRITRETGFFQKAGFPDLSGKNVYHIQRFH
jgi:hypothetical protein